MPGHTDGARPREALLSALSDVVRNKTPPCGGHHSQGKHQLAMNTHTNARECSDLLNLL